MYISPKYLIVKLFLSLFIFVITYHFGSLYVNGDQAFYSTWYREFGKRGLADAYVYFSAQVNPFEIFYFFITWLGASHLEKIVFDCIVNIVFVLLLASALQKYSMHPLVIFIVITTSFYVPVLLLAAERLKFGFIAGLMFVLVSTQFKRILWGATSLIGHLQMAIPMAAVFLGRIIDRSGSKSRREVISARSLFLFACSLLLILYVVSGLPGLFDYLKYKLLSYWKLNPLDFGKQFIFFLLSVYCAKENWRFVLGVFLILGISAIIIGAERITIISYFAFLFFSTFKDRGLNFPNYIVGCYMFYKAILFYLFIHEFGNGFAIESNYFY